MNVEPADTKPETVAPAAKPAVAVAKRSVAKKTTATRRPAGNHPDGRGARAETRTTPSGARPVDDATSKAGLIRKVASIIAAKGEQPRPSEIVKILGEEGVTVSAAQVSQTLKAAGYGPLRQRRASGSAGVARATKPRSMGRASQTVTLDDLLAAKSVSGAFGGTDKAIAALEALKRLEG